MTGLPLPVLVGLIAGTVVFLLRAVALHRAAADRSALLDSALLSHIVDPTGPGRRWGRAVILALGVGLLSAALVAGGFADGSSEDNDTRFETVLVLDASNSMLAEDVEPSRVRQEQLLARRLISRIGGRIGIVYFAGSGYVLSPLTEDKAATLMFAEAVHPTNVGRGGTSLADGLEQALVVLAGGRPDAVRSVILLSDGETTVDEDRLDTILQRARRANVAIQTIGLGTVEGARIPMPLAPGARPPAGLGVPNASGPGDGRRWLRDGSGQVVVTFLDETGLRKIAAATGGLHVTGVAGTGALLERLPASGGMSPTEAGTVNLLLLFAFLLLLVEAYAFRSA